MKAAGPVIIVIAYLVIVMMWLTGNLSNQIAAVAMGGTTVLMAVISLSARFGRTSADLDTPTKKAMDE